MKGQKERIIIFLTVVITLAFLACVFLGDPSHSMTTDISKYLLVHSTVSEDRSKWKHDTLPHSLEGFDVSEYRYFYRGPSTYGLLALDLLLGDEPVTYSLLLKVKSMAPDLAEREKERLLSAQQLRHYTLKDGELYADEETGRSGIDGLTDDQVYDGMNYLVNFVLFPAEGGAIYCEANYYDALEKDEIVMDILKQLRPAVIELAKQELTKS